MQSRYSGSAKTKRCIAGSVLRSGCFVSLVYFSFLRGKSKQGEYGVHIRGIDGPLVEDEDEDEKPDPCT